MEGKEGGRGQDLGNPNGAYGRGKVGGAQTGELLREWKSGRDPD